MFGLDIFRPSRAVPKTLRVTVAVYPDGHEVRIWLKIKRPGAVPAQRFNRSGA